MTPGSPSPVYSLRHDTRAIEVIEWIGADRYYYQADSRVWRSARCVGINRCGSNAHLMVMPAPAAQRWVVNGALEIEMICARLQLPVATHYVNLTPAQAERLAAQAERWHLPCTVIRGERHRWLRKPLAVCTLVAPFVVNREEYDAAHPGRAITGSAVKGYGRCG